MERNTLKLHNVYDLPKQDFNYCLKRFSSNLLKEIDNEILIENHSQIAFRFFYCTINLLNAQQSLYHFFWHAVKNDWDLLKFTKITHLHDAHTNYHLLRSTALNYQSLAKKPLPLEREGVVIEPPPSGTPQSYGPPPRVGSAALNLLG